MTEPQRPLDLDALGEFVASHVDGALDPQARLRERERIVATTTARPRAAWWIGGALAAAATAVVLLWWSPWAAAPPSQPDDRVAAAPDRTWVQAPSHGEAALAVGTGASLSLHDGARGRVSLADTQQVLVVLESGTMRAQVDPAAHRTVAIEAGPYRVAVVGTAFDVVWLPDDGELAVTVSRGKVEVHTPTSSAPIAVDAGHRLVAREGDVALARLPTAAPADTDTDTDASTEVIVDADDDAEPTPRPTAPRPRSKPTPSAAPDWQQLAEAGQYAEALASIERDGLDDAIAKLPAASLERLGDVARLAARPQQATTIYRGIRKRFAGTPAAARAAFQLGRLAADHQRDPAAAATWLSTYLDEAPRGSFAKLARGRLVAALRDAGRRAEARDAARVYLDSYPDGPHAKLAQALLDAP
ncbi:MAG: FecR family protein [Nannocystaceae bacterium]|nr:FecR family protein [Nannocystaceae bacterium]